MSRERTPHAENQAAALLAMLEAIDTIPSGHYLHTARIWRYKPEGGEGWGWELEVRYTLGTALFLSIQQGVETRRARAVEAYNAAVAHDGRTEEEDDQ